MYQGNSARLQQAEPPPVKVSSAERGPAGSPAPTRSFTHPRLGSSRAQCWGAHCSALVPAAGPSSTLRPKFALCFRLRSGRGSPGSGKFGLAVEVFGWAVAAESLGSGTKKGTLGTWAQAGLQALLGEPGHLDLSPPQHEAGLVVERLA